jgi:hypothetical protein
MIVKITVKEDIEAPVWDTEKFKAISDFPAIEVYGSDKQQCINAVKGSVLCTLGLWEVPPDKVEFKCQLI